MSIQSQRRRRQAFGWGIEDAKREAVGLPTIHFAHVRNSQRNSIRRAYVRGYETVVKCRPWKHRGMACAGADNGR